MTYASNETSVEMGAPVVLYEFSIGSEFFFYTSAEDTQTVSGTDYLPIEISNSRIKVNTEQRTGRVDITLKANNEFAAKYIGIQPSNIGSVKISRFHRFDTPTPQVIEIFRGDVVSSAFIQDTFSVKLAVMPLTEALGRQTPKNTYQTPCNWLLGDEFCKIDLPGSFTVSLTVTAVAADGVTLTIPGLDAADPLVTPKGTGWARAGKITIPSNSDVRSILEHNAVDTVKILLPFDSSILNAAVNIAAGCPHSIQACKSDFNNVINYGGAAFVPLRNVFQTGLN